MKVLVVEDDEHIRNGLMEILEMEGFEPLGAADGRQALDMFQSEAIDFVCLDIMMPKMNGYDVCRRIRHEAPHLPVIFISAKTEEADRVLGLELGADDFILKPFGVREVVARIRAVARRAFQNRPDPTGENAPFRIADLEVTPAQLRAFRSDQAIELSLRDVRVLRLFHRRAGQVVDRQTLYKEIWGWSHQPNSRCIDQLMAQLRKKIEVHPHEPHIIHTIYGGGYRYDAPGAPGTEGQGEAGGGGE